MAHGTPATPDEIEPFYTRIRRGRPPTAEQLADLRRRYDAIGGTSPLAARTGAQVAGLADRLAAAEPGRFVVRYGAKHTAPSIEEAAGELAGAGVGRVLGLVLTPHRSTMGSGEYLARAAHAFAAAGGPGFTAIEQWYDAPGFAELLAERVLAALGGLPGPAHPALVVFTAHSLPERVVAEGDPYPNQLAASAAAVAGAAGLADAGVAWRVAWQSAGRTPEPWLGPDILAVLRGLPDEGFAAAVVCPVGFVTDHLEVLYDLDIEARQVAESAGVAFGRTASLNDDPRFLAILADVVRTAAAERRAGAGAA
jgi:ferrochelatase